MYENLHTLKYASPHVVTTSLTYDRCVNYREIVDGLPVNITNLSVTFYRVNDKDMCVPPVICAPGVRKLRLYVKKYMPSWDVTVSHGQNLGSLGEYMYKCLQQSPLQKLTIEYFITPSPHNKKRQATRYECRNKIILHDNCIQYYKCPEYTSSTCEFPTSRPPYVEVARGEWQVEGENVGNIKVQLYLYGILKMHYTCVDG